MDKVNRALELYHIRLVVKVILSDLVFIGLVSPFSLYFKGLAEVTKGLIRTEINSIFSELL